MPLIEDEAFRELVIGSARRASDDDGMGVSVAIPRVDLLDHSVGEIPVAVADSTQLQAAKRLAEWLVPRMWIEPRLTSLTRVCRQNSALQLKPELRFSPRMTEHP